MILLADHRNLSPYIMETHLLKLYIAGKTPRAKLAIGNLRRICEVELEGQYGLEIIDVIENPHRAERAKILFTPTLVKSLPTPIRRVIGDLSNAAKVLVALDIVPLPHVGPGNPPAKDHPPASPDVRSR